MEIREYRLQARRSAAIGILMIVLSMAFLFYIESSLYDTGKKLFHKKVSIENLSEISET